MKIGLSVIALGASVVLGLFGCGDPARQSSDPANTSASTASQVSMPKRGHFDGFSFQIPTGWTQIAPDQEKTKASLLLGDVPRDLPKGQIPATTKGMIKVDAGGSALSSPRETAAAFAKNFSGEVQSGSVDVDGEKGVPVQISSQNPELMPRSAIIVVHNSRLYMIMAGAAGGVDVSDALEQIRKTWKWGE